MAGGVLRGANFVLRFQLHFCPGERSPGMHRVVLKGLACRQQQKLYLWRVRVHSTCMRLSCTSTCCGKGTFVQAWEPNIRSKPVRVYSQL